MSSPPPSQPQFVPPSSVRWQSAAQRREASAPNAWPGGFLVASFLGWLALSSAVMTGLIEPPAQGIFFRFCLIATPFAIAAGVVGIVFLTQWRDQLRAAEVQRADAMREPRT